MSKNKIKLSNYRVKTWWCRELKHSKYKYKFEFKKFTMYYGHLFRKGKI